MAIALDARPKVRQDLTFTKEHRDGEEMVVVTDPWGLQDSSLLLSDKVHALLQVLDGSRSLAEIERKFSRQAGRHRFSLSELTALVQQFDELLLLDNAGYRRAFEEQVKGFLESSVRLPAHAGHSYPATPDVLLPWLDNILAPPRQPPLDALPKVESGHGVPEGSVQLSWDDLPHTPAPADTTPTPEVTSPVMTAKEQSTLAAVIAPHLDPRVETAAYGAAFRGLQGMNPARVILLGTGHEIRGGLFSLTFKSYTTPLGEVPTDLDAVDSLLDAGFSICSPHDLAHRSEHALEFQLPFLQRVLARPDIPVVPILCGSLHDWYGRAKRFEDIPHIQKFVEAFRALLTPDTLVVAGVDFAHIGHKFGDKRSGRQLYKAAHAHDQRLLQDLCKGNAQAFWRRNTAQRDRYNVCGFSSLSLLLTAIPGLRGEVKRHDYWFEDETESAVSFAAVHLHRTA